jgi:FKBP-type peptidyl-prolyl cis-trans isomerase FkpA
MKCLTLLGPAALFVLFASGCNQTESSQTSSSSSGTMSTSAQVTPSATSAETPSSQPAPAMASAQPPGEPAGSAQPVEMPGGLRYVDLKVGDGDIAEAGLTASVHYTGWLTDGTKFDSSVDRGQPFEFKIGGGGVIRGWEEGVKGMRIGGKRKLTIPPDMGYGANGYPPVIPANATLVFDIELLGLRH